MRPMRSILVIVDPVGSWMSAQGKERQLGDVIRQGSAFSPHAQALVSFALITAQLNCNRALVAGWSVSHRWGEALSPALGI